MKSHFVGLLAVVALLSVAAEIPVVFAQNPPPAPMLVRPLFNSTTPGGDAIDTNDAEVSIMPLPNVPFYDICLKDSNASACYFRRTFAVAEGVAGANGSLRFFVTIPEDRQSTVGLWTAASCRGTGPGQCGIGAPFQSFLVLPRHAAVSQNGQVNGRNVSFQWADNPRGNAGSQLIVLAGQQPGLAGFSGANPTVVSAPNMSIQLNEGVTSHTLTLPSGILRVKWAVGACHNFGTVSGTTGASANGTPIMLQLNKGRRCSLRYASWRGLTVPDSFANTFVPTFQHARCVNCHAVAAENFQNDPASNPNGGLPSNHPAANSMTNCASCHTNALLPSQGTVNPGWHAAPPGMDFRNRTVQQLCLSAHFGAGNDGTVTGVLNHLNQDKLILWAVGDGRVPNGTTKPTAPPNNIEIWRTQVQAWVDLGMPCG